MVKEKEDSCKSENDMKDLDKVDKWRGFDDEILTRPDDGSTTYYVGTEG